MELRTPSARITFTAVRFWLGLHRHPGVREQALHTAPPRPAKAHFIGEAVVVTVVFRARTL
jgi:hypothetical protein